METGFFWRQKSFSLLHFLHQEENAAQSLLYPVVQQSTMIILVPNITLVGYRTPTTTTRLMHLNNDSFVSSLHRCRVFTCNTTWQPKPGQGRWVFPALLPYISNIRRPHCFINAFKTIAENLTVKSHGVLHTEVGLIRKTVRIQTVVFLH